MRNAIVATVLGLMLMAPLSAAVLGPTPLPESLVPAGDPQPEGPVFATAPPGLQDLDPWVDATVDRMFGNLDMDTSSMLAVIPGNAVGDGPRVVAGKGDDSICQDGMCGGRHMALYGTSADGAEWTFELTLFGPRPDQSCGFNGLLDLVGFPLCTLGRLLYGLLYGCVRVPTCAMVFVFEGRWDPTAGACVPRADDDVQLCLGRAYADCILGPLTCNEHVPTFSTAWSLTSHLRGHHGDVDFVLVGA